ncbi:MAG: hypothetical protein O7E57_04595 [Gammaproteobacteria bacterium]|nr:hypothetical protein [Gammaproteobacteria bacterium]
MTDSIGEFAFHHTGNALVKNDDGVVVAYASYEGTATGFGTVMGTVAFPLPESGAASGTCSWTGQGFPPDSPWTTSFGDGTWEQVEGKYAWKISIPVIEISDGTRIRSEGELDLEAKTFNGQMFDAG